MRAKSITAALLAAAALAVSAGAASARALPGPLPHLAAVPAAIRCELDNGTTWTLSACRAGRKVTSTGAEAGYADGGIVVDLGPASSFTGVQVSGSGPLAENIWIADGSEATVPGTHALSAGVDFTYGLGVAGGWYIVGKPGPYSGQTLTAAQVRADFAGHEVYAWVGVSTSGTAASAYVSAVNGQFADAEAAIAVRGGKVTVSVTPDWLF